MNQELFRITGAKRPISFFWSEREDGSELLSAHYPDDNSAAVLLPAEIRGETAEELLHGISVLSLVAA